MEKRKFGSFTSSEDPQKFSQTWANVFGLIGTILTALLAMKGVDATVANEQVKAITEPLTVLAASSIAIWQGAQALIGAVKKFAAWWGAKG